MNTYEILSINQNDVEGWIEDNELEATTTIDESTVANIAQGLIDYIAESDIYSEALRSVLTDMGIINESEDE